MDFPALGRKLRILPKTTSTTTPAAQPTSTEGTPQGKHPSFFGLTPRTKSKTKTVSGSETQLPPRNSSNFFSHKAKAARTQQAQAAASSTQKAARALFAERQGHHAPTLEGAHFKFLSVHDCPEVVDQLNAAAEAHAKRTGDREALKDTFAILRGLRMKPDDQLVTACFVDGLPVGLIATSTPHHDPDLALEKRHLTVESIVTLPGVPGRGGALIEHAAELSQAAGRGGNLFLKAFQGAEKAYEAWGFEEVKNQDERLTMKRMFVRPSASDKWCPIGGLWRLRKNVSPEHLQRIGLQGDAQTDAPESSDAPPAQGEMASSSRGEDHD